MGYSKYRILDNLVLTVPHPPTTGNFSRTWPPALWPVHRPILILSLTVTLTLAYLLACSQSPHFPF